MGLGALIEEHYLILNNELGKVTKLIQRNMTSIIDFTFTTPDIGVLDAWKIDDKVSTRSDREVIVCNLTNLDETVGGMRTSQKITGWSVKALPDEKKKEACANWHQAAAERSWMIEGSLKDDIEREAEWIEFTLTEILDKNATQIRVTGRSKRWWNTEIEAKQNEHGRTRRLNQQGRADAFTVRTERNSY